MKKESMSNKDKIPSHIAIIMDGNGRWAEQRGEQRLKGHLKGVTSVRVAIEGCVKHRVKYLSLYAFSTENWGRPQEEVKGLMDLFCSTIAKELSSLIKEGVRLRFMGRIEELSEGVKENIRIAEELTKENHVLEVIIALNYSSYSEITDAVRKIACEVQKGVLSPAEITEEMIGKMLYIHDIPNPDLLIRTSGEVRLSNFMLWQLAYSEFYFTNVLWPDFAESDLLEAIAEFGKRVRRYGKI